MHLKLNEFEIHYNSMKTKLLYALCVLALVMASCAKQAEETVVDATKPYKVSSRSQWVKELKHKNPLKRNRDYISVYFRFDTIINDFEVSGILYPSYRESCGWNDSENGVRMFFHSVKTGKEYVWTDEGKNIFMSKNVYDIVNNENFEGFRSGDAYIFHYYDERDTFTDVNSDKPQTSAFCSDAEYQFCDIDFDGKEELLIGYYRGGQYGISCFDAYEMVDSKLVGKYPINQSEFFNLDTYTTIDSVNRRVITYNRSGCCGWSKFFYEADKDGNLRCIYHVSSWYDEEKDAAVVDTTFVTK